LFICFSCLPDFIDHSSKYSFPRISSTPHHWSLLLVIVDIFRSRLSIFPIILAFPVLEFEHRVARFVTWLYSFSSQYNGHSSVVNCLPNMLKSQVPVPTNTHRGENLLQNQPQLTDTALWTCSTLKHSPPQLHQR
jgi:hypothetical protein